MNRHPLALTVLLLGMACSEPANTSDRGDVPSPSPVRTQPAEIPVGSEFEWAQRTEEGVETPRPASVVPALPPPSPEDMAAVRTAVSRYAGQAKYCYETELRADPDLAGVVELRWSLGNGAARDVRLVRDGVGSDALVRCLVGKVSKWEFPARLTGTVDWPFRFRPEPG